MPFSIYAFIGVIMLTGMAAKNAILLIDYTNVLRARGLELFDAVQRASQVRFRPVIMTTLSTVLGLLPIALGYGAGGEARAPLGVAVASGLLVTTLLTLVAIPVVYALLERTRARLTRRGPEQKGGDA
jgi:multidrug efflux pump subunit AcrB